MSNSLSFTFRLLVMKNQCPHIIHDWTDEEQKANLIGNYEFEGVFWEAPCHCRSPSHHLHHHLTFTFHSLSLSHCECRTVKCGKMESAWEPRSFFLNWVDPKVQLILFYIIQPGQRNVGSNSKWASRPTQLDWEVFHLLRHCMTGRRRLERKLNPGTGAW